MTGKSRVLLEGERFVVDNSPEEILQYGYKEAADAVADSGLGHECNCGKCRRMGQRVFRVRFIVLEEVTLDNLKDQVSQGDEPEWEMLPALVSYLYNELPSSCWGSRDKVNQWLQQSEGEHKAILAALGVDHG